MLLPIRKLSGFKNSISAGAQMLAPLGGGVTYHTLYLDARDAAGPRTEAELRTDIEKIQLIIKSKTKWNATAAQVIDLTQRYPYQLRMGNDFFQDQGYLPIELSPRFFRGQELAFDLGLGMADLEGENDAILQVDLSAAHGITRLDLYGELGPNGPAGVIRCFRQHTKTWTATGDESEPYSLSRDEALIAIHHTLGATPGVVDVDHGVDLLVNGTSQYQVRARHLEMLLRAGFRTPIAGYVHFDLMLRGLYGSILFGGGRPANPALGTPAQKPVSSLVRKTNWSTLPAAYIEIYDTVEPALSDRSG